ncbi:MAG: methyl-accepting chemotaxis protein [Bacteroidales bacterium]|jgi:methyl-accepting chemotaxis protein|nr:methyl-accepting chemotaxis protein [Bacteroidales bacterium]
MKFFYNLNLRSRLVLQYLLVTVIPILIFSFLIINRTSNSIKEIVTNNLTNVLEINKERIQSNLEEFVQDMSFVTTTRDFKEAVEDFTNYHTNSKEDITGPIDITNKDYLIISNNIKAYFNEILKVWGYYDVFIICKEHAHVLYTVVGESDLGTSLITGPYKNKGLASCWQKVVDSGKPQMVDFGFYPPSNGNFAFIGIPVFNEKDDIVSVFVLQLSKQNVSEFLNHQVYGSKTGEMFLIGEDYRARTYYGGFELEMKDKPINTVASRGAMNNESGEGIILDYRNKEVLVSYSSLGLDEFDFLEADFDWGIIAKIDRVEALKAVRNLKIWVLVISLIIIFFVIVLAFSSAKGIVNPIVKLLNIADSIGKGNLAISVPSLKRNDEVGQLQLAISKMKDNLRNQVENVTEGVQVLTAAVGEISTTLAQFSASSQETVTSVTETTATVEQVRQTVQVAMDRAQEVSESAQRTIEIADEGEKSVEETITGMNSIDAQMDFIARRIMKLSEQSQAIGEIVSTISRLAEQLNLLAVNAAIEAARPGEEGKVFSVVAEEVKTLADLSKQATKQVREILSDVQKATSDAVMATEEGARAVQKGLEMAEYSGGAIKSLADVIDEASQSSLQIGASTKQQFVGIDQVNEAMRSINTASNQNLESSRQLEVASGRLQELGKNLLKEMDQYTL